MQLAEIAYALSLVRTGGSLNSCVIAACSVFQGRFELNDIHNNKLAGVWIKNYASPLFRKNNIHHGRDVGFFIFQDGQVRWTEREREGGAMVTLVRRVYCIEKCH